MQWMQMSDESINSKVRNNFRMWRKVLLRVLKERWREEIYRREELKISKILSSFFSYLYGS